MKLIATSKYAALCMACLVASVALAAAPASRPAKSATKPATTPATQPAAATKPVPALAAKDSVAVVSQRIKATFRVPKAWTTRDLRLTDGETFAWDCVTGPTRGAVATQQREMRVHLGGEGQLPTAAAFAELMRGKARAHFNADITFIRDEAVRWNDRDCWVLEYPGQSTLTQTTTVNGKTTTKTMTIALVYQDFLWIEDQATCSIAFSADERDAPAMRRIAEQVRGTFKFGE